LRGHASNGGGKVGLALKWPPPGGTLAGNPRGG